MKKNADLIIESFLLITSFILSLCIGKYPLSIKEIALVIVGKPYSEIGKSVFLNLRLPRTIMAVLAGAGLGSAGYVYQSLFRNPLASPDIIGISSGANLGAALVIVLFSGSLTSITAGSFIGGLLAVGFVMILVRLTKSNTTATYVLSGIIISSIAKAGIMILKFFADNDSDLAAIEYWTMGSLSSVTAAKVLSIVPFWISGFILTFLLHRQIELLSLNEDEAKSLGVRIKQMRILVLSCSTLLVASVISVTGLISFAGLISPHIAKLIHKKQGFRTLVLSSLTGSIVMLISDILCRSLLSSEIPISIFTTLIGVPVLVFFMIRRKGNRL